MDSDEMIYVDTGKFLIWWRQNSSTLSWNIHSHRTCGVLEFLRPLFSWYTRYYWSLQNIFSHEIGVIWYYIPLIALLESTDQVMPLPCECSNRNIQFVKFKVCISLSTLNICLNSCRYSFLLCWHTVYYRTLREKIVTVHTPSLICWENFHVIVDRLANT